MHGPQSLRGTGLDFAVLDECAYMQAELWPEVVRPMLADREGRALLSSTPRGFNHFYDLHQESKSRSEWAAFHYQTGLERGQQLHLTFAGNAKIAEDSLNHPLIMFTLDALVCGRRQRFCADEIFLKPTTEKFLHSEQVPYILLNRPFLSRLWINCSMREPLNRLFHPWRSSTYSCEDVGVKESRENQSRMSDLATA